MDAALIANECAGTRLKVNSLEFYTSWILKSISSFPVPVGHGGTQQND